MLKNLQIIGTSHISRDSINEINNSIESFKPDIIAVELDKRRYYSLLLEKQKNSSLPNIFKIGLSGYLFLIIGKFLQKKLGSIVGVEPGSDMKKAVELAKQNNISLELIDRDIEITLKRFSQKFSFKEKITLFKDLFSAPFSKKKMFIDISKVPKKELINKILNELKNRYPNIYSVLIEERNKYMAKKLFKISKENVDKKILCVIGAGHEEGLKKELKELYYSNISFF
ncbi:TraB family protein [Candidatus Woesearchaeota archaeon]|nr:TraB family protein [Candidatus Woesearchaeota archaeon]